MADIKELLPAIRENVSLADYTSFKIGGWTKYFFEANTKNELIKALKAIEQTNLSFFILAGGSNVLFSDNGFDGLVIKIQFSDFECQDLDIYADAGAKLLDIVNLSVEKELTGLEWAAGIYGTIGGAVRGNAGAFNSSITNVLKQVKVLVLPDLKIKNFSRDECKFGYRESIFKKNNNLIILSAILELKKGNKKKIKEEIENNIAYRKDNHPLDKPSAGSIFKNPEFKMIDKGLFKDYPDLKKFSSSGTVPAGFLIDTAGLRGKRIGNAKISEKHCNFIVNLGKATAEDVLGLIDLAKETIRALFGIELEQEIIIVK
ncbi:UDP-N-acetylmuramate dehydrogenase [Patescibacteria group bacterium]|nr:UDP-N-acetylmuramate dehydrogenase [Patescibacteria group bacterium]MBU4023312.1 UDP-N-acetylmuramate dehydrogenase [Patescibacteria group bacterium]MBU4078395.1 UDP-N-acetylmuramate dehydrogenase [Patescibacteria group bacterium]